MTRLGNEASYSTVATHKELNLRKQKVMDEVLANTKADLDARNPRFTSLNGFPIIEAPDAPEGSDEATDTSRASGNHPTKRPSSARVRAKLRKAGGK